MTSCTVKLDFGGDYKTWRSEMSSILYSHDPIWLPVARNTLQDQQRSLEVSLVICSNVSSALLLQVPSDDRFDAPRLLTALRKLSEPFRLFDLPAELRVRIYDMYFQIQSSGQETYDVLEAYCNPVKVYPLLPLTRVSRQLRLETLDLFISSTTLYLTLPDCTNEEIAMRINKLERVWAANNAKAYVRHLRTVYIDMYSTFGYTLTFDEKHGLRLTFHEHAPKRLRGSPQLKAYIEGVEGDRRVLGLKGESIVLAMIKDPNIWIFKKR